MNTIFHTSRMEVHDTKEAKEEDRTISVARANDLIAKANTMLKAAVATQKTDDHLTAGKILEEVTVSFDTAARKLQEDLLAHAAKQPAPPRAQWSKTLSLVQAIAKREEEASQKLCSQAKTELKSEDVPKSGAKRQRR